MGDLNMNCDRMSHDHLQCVHLRWHRHDKNRSLDVMVPGVKNLDVMIHHDCHLKMGDLMMVCLMKI